ncbi:MAG: bile acid:sodium symporter family protein [Halobacteriovoraceae bacterium]|nr:bile acid:sodium symporter family protein [Halobacteriovoraceae bacterium]
MNVTTQIILPLVLAFIMFSMGLSLTINDFKRVARFPRAFFIGAFLQIISLPLLAFLIAKIWFDQGQADPALAVGLMIIAACPGGVTSNLMTQMGRGDRALSISLTAIIGLLCVLTIPLVVNYSHYAFMGPGETPPLPIGKTIGGIFCLTTVPVLIGMLIKARKEDFARQLEPTARKMASIFFIIIVIAAIAKERNLLINFFGTVGPMVLIFNLSIMGVALVVSKLVALKPSQTIAITLECGLQNGTLAIMIALTFLDNEIMMIPGGIYSLLMFLTGGAYLCWVWKKERPRETS